MLTVGTSRQFTVTVRHTADEVPQELRIEFHPLFLQAFSQVCFASNRRSVEMLDRWNSDVENRFQN